MGSASSVAFYTSRHMVDMGHSVTIIERRNSETEPPLEYIEGVRFVRLEAKRISSYPLKEVGSFPLGPIRLILDGIRFAIKANQYIKEAKCDFDIVQVHFPLAANILIMLNRDLRRKMVYTVHADEYRLNLSTRMKLPWYLRVVSPDLFLMKRVRKVVVLNESIRSKLILSGRVPRQNILAIPNGIETKTFNMNVDTDEIKRKYGLIGKVTILFVGPIMPRKGLEYLTRAADIIINRFKYQDVVLLLVGFFAVNKYAQKISKLINKYGLEENVRLTSFLSFDDLRKLQATCDLFVLPSLEEGFGMALTEAMAYGKPVIGTRVGGILTQINDGWNGFLVEPGNQKELARKIMYLLDNPKERIRMGKNSNRWVRRKFDWREIAIKYLRVYASLKAIG